MDEKHLDLVKNQVLRRLKDRKTHQRRLPHEKIERAWLQYAKPPVPKPGTTRARNTRFVSVARAYREWADIEKMVAFYRVCATLNELGIGKFVVDHIVPLNSPFVCGLHTHDNLQIVTLRHNRGKSNIAWPQMWPLDWEVFCAYEDFIS